MRPIALLTLALATTPALAQQFVERPGVVPGPPLWSEVAVVYDVQNDGLWDVLFVNAQGWEKPGDFGAPNDQALPPTLVIGTGLQAGLPTFEDRSSQYFPASLKMHGKNAAACDLDGDGRTDLAFAVAFGSRQRLFLKDSQSETYIDRSERIPLPAMNGFGVGWGDLDDDGDLDLVFADAGPSSFSAPGGVARLLLNDGQAFFSDASAQLGATPKIGAQNAKLVDIDSDLDLDVVIDGKSPLTQVYLNDGKANFSAKPTAVTPGAPFAEGAYETEWADMDGDLDLDGMLMNFTGVYVNAGMRNLLDETGNLELRATSAYISGSNDQDENDFAFIDSDDDGDLDVITSTLLGPFIGEKLLINSGSFGLGSLALDPNGFTAIDNATLDVDLADFDGDGDYDAITAEGEFPIVDFTNLYYENTGVPDTRAPRIGRISDLGTSVAVEDLAAGVPLRSWIEDAVVDDGSTFVTARVNWNLATTSGGGSGFQAMRHVGGNVHRAALKLLLPPSIKLVGGTLSYEVEANDPMGNTSSLAGGSFEICGSEVYGAGTGLTLTLPESPVAGGSADYMVQGGPADGTGFVLVAAGPDAIPFAGGSLLVQPSSAKRVPITLDANGETVGSFLVGGGLGGQRIYAQAIIATPSGGQPFLLSGGLDTLICTP